MVIIETPLLLQREIARIHQQNLRIALVIIDSAAEESQQALLTAARAQADVVVATLFPVPWQQTTMAQTPPAVRQQDYEALHHLGVALVFAPSLSALYATASPPVMQITLETPQLPADSLDLAAGLSMRATVFCQCLNMIQPDVVCLSEQPALSGWLARRIITALHYPLRLAIIPAARTQEGLTLDAQAALTAEQRRLAPHFYQQLKNMAAQIRHDPGAAQAAIAQATAALTAQAFRVEALSVSDAYTLAPLNNASNQALIAGAVWLGQTRLVDNVTLPLDALPAVGDGY